MQQMSWRWALDQTVWSLWLHCHTAALSVTLCRFAHRPCRHGHAGMRCRGQAHMSMTVWQALHAVSKPLTRHHFRQCSRQQRLGSTVLHSRQMEERSGLDVHKLHQPLPIQAFAAAHL